MLLLFVHLLLLTGVSYLPLDQSSQKSTPAHERIAKGRFSPGKIAKEEREPNATLFINLLGDDTIVSDFASGLIK